MKTDDPCGGLAANFEPRNAVILVTGYDAHVLVLLTFDAHVQLARFGWALIIFVMRSSWRPMNCSDCLLRRCSASRKSGVLLFIGSFLGHTARPAVAATCASLRRSVRAWVGRSPRSSSVVFVAVLLLGVSVAFAPAGSSQQSRRVRWFHFSLRLVLRVDVRTSAWIRWNLPRLFCHIRMR